MSELTRRAAIGLGVLSGPAMLATSAQADEPHRYVPEEGFVPTTEVAIAIAVAVWGPIYGARKIAAEAPYRATLDDGIWTVRGSLPAGRKGGVALAEIAKADGRILRVSHGK